MPSLPALFVQADDINKRVHTQLRVAACDQGLLTCEMARWGSRRLFIDAPFRRNRRHGSIRRAPGKRNLIRAQTC